MCIYIIYIWYGHKVKYSPTWLFELIFFLARPFFAPILVSAGPGGSAQWGRRLDLTVHAIFADRQLRRRCRPSDVRALLRRHSEGRSARPPVSSPTTTRLRVDVGALAAGSLSERCAWNGVGPEARGTVPADRADLHEASVQVVRLQTKPWQALVLWNTITCSGGSSLWDDSQRRYYCELVHLTAWNLWTYESHHRRFEVARGSLNGGWV